MKKPIAPENMTHIYAKLGKPPYALVGYIEDAPYQDANGAWHGGTHSCDHCGQSIIHVFMCKSSDGKHFNLGSVHVEYLGDEGIRDAVKQKMAEVRREAREAKRQAEWEAQRPEREARMAEQARIEQARLDHIKNEYKRIAPVLQAQPHPTRFFARQGKTLLDYVNYFLHPENDPDWHNWKFLQTLQDWGASI